MPDDFYGEILCEGCDPRMQKSIRGWLVRDKVGKMRRSISQKRSKKGWLVEHHGLGSGIFTVYHTRAKAEYEVRNIACECSHKPIRCTITYTSL